MSLFQGGGMQVIKAQALAAIAQWGNIPAHFQTAKLLTSEFWLDAAEVLVENAPAIVNQIVTRQGVAIVKNYETLKDFVWIIYMPTPAETQIPSPSFIARLPGLKIAGQDVFLQFGDRGSFLGGRRGRLFGFGFGARREWQSQFFRMDYHRTHAFNDWVARGANGNEFHFEAPRFSREAW